VRLRWPAARVAATSRLGCGPSIQGSTSASGFESWTTQTSNAPWPGPAPRSRSSMPSGCTASSRSTTAIPRTAEGRTCPRASSSSACCTRRALIYRPLPLRIERRSKSLLNGEPGRHHREIPPGRYIFENTRSVPGSPPSEVISALGCCPENSGDASSAHDRRLPICSISSRLLGTESQDTPGWCPWTRSPFRSEPSLSMRSRRRLSRKRCSQVQHAPKGLYLRSSPTTEGFGGLLCVQSVSRTGRESRSRAAGFPKRPAPSPWSDRLLIAAVWAPETQLRTCDQALLVMRRLVRPDESAGARPSRSLLCGSDWACHDEASRCAWHVGVDGTLDSAENLWGFLPLIELPGRYLTAWWWWSGVWCWDLRCRCPGSPWQICIGFL